MLATEEKPAEELQSGGITLGHLLMLMALLDPAMVVIGDVHHAGGGITRYAIGVLSALALGALIVWLLWNGGRFCYLRSINRSERVRSCIALGVYAVDLAAIIAGMILGTRLASFLVKHIV